MMKPFFFFFLGLILTFPGSGQVQDYFPSVVRITAQKDFGEDVGTGIIIGQDGRNVYVLTALHVVEEASSTEVMLYQQKEKQVAELILQEESLDLAVLKLPTRKAPYFPTLYPADAALFQMEAPVRSIGHPAGGFWKLNSLNKIQETELYMEERKFSITPQAIVGGCSGGPVFYQNGAWMGMVTETSMVEGTCVKAQVIQEWIKENEIPDQFIYFPKIEVLFVQGGKTKKLNPYNYFDPQKVKDFYLSKNEISIEDFAAFAISTNYQTDNEKLNRGVILGTVTYIGEDRPEYILTYSNNITWRNDALGKVIKVDDWKKYPVIHVSGNDANAYSNWLTSISGQKYRLPTIGELIYVRLPEKPVKAPFEPYENVFDFSYCEQLGSGWCEEEGEATYNDDFPTVSPSGAFAPYGLGVNDLFGNVGEWSFAYYYPDEMKSGYKEVTNFGEDWLFWVWNDTWYGKFGPPEEGTDKNGWWLHSYRWGGVVDIMEDEGIQRHQWNEVFDAEGSSNFIGIRLVREK